jgi:hypothetical protein
MGSNDSSSSTKKPTNDNKSRKQRLPLWLLYLGLALAGLLLIAKGFDIAHLSRWTAQLGIALVYTALTFLVLGGKPHSWTGVVVVWAAAIGGCFF